MYCRSKFKHSGHRIPSNGPSCLRLHKRGSVLQMGGIGTTSFCRSYWCKGTVPIHQGLASCFHPCRCFRSGHWLQRQGKGQQPSAASLNNRYHVSSFSFFYRSNCVYEPFVCLLFTPKVIRIVVLLLVLKGGGCWRSAGGQKTWRGVGGWDGLALEELLIYSFFLLIADLARSLSHSMFMSWACSLFLPFLASAITYSIAYRPLFMC